MAIGARLRAAGCWSLSRTQFVANLSAMAPLERDLEQASPSTPVGSIFNLRPSSNEFSWSGQLATPASPAPDHLADAPHRQAFATGMWASDYLLGQVGSKPRFSRSEEHTSELQSLMRISYAVFCLKKKT